MSALEIGRKLDAYTGVVVNTGINDNGNEIVYSSGNSTGYVLEVDNPVGTQGMADAILAGLKLRGARYQPFAATDALLDPSAEIGDGVTANGTNAVIMSISRKHSPLMSADVSAPYDEEVDHEFKYEPKTFRQFKRESAYVRSRITQTESQISLEVARATQSEEELSSRITLTSDAITAEVTRASQAEGSLSSRITLNADAITSEVTRATNAEGDLSGRITINADAITSEVSRASSAEGSLSTRITQNANGITSEVTARQTAVQGVADDLADEVSRATGAEGTLSSRITQNATDITAKVSKTGGSASSFAWTLTDSSWSLKSNNTEVLKVNSSGLSVNGSGTFSGTITATGGYIGTSASGFAINSSNIQNGMTSLSDTTHNGIYIGTDGIALGKGAFKVTSSGDLTCSSVTITGGNVYASSIKHGSTGGYLSGSGIAVGTLYGGTSGQLAGETLSNHNMISSINTNLGYGAGYGAAIINGTSSYPSYFSCGNLNNKGQYLQINGQVCQLLTKTISGTTIHYLGYV